MKYHPKQNPFAFIHSHNVNHTSRRGGGMVVPDCLYGRCDYTFLEDRKCIPFHTIGAAYSGVYGVTLTFFDFIQ